MANSIRELILVAVQAQIEAIATGGGYEFSVSTVERARRVFFDDELPAVGIFDTTEETARDDYNDIHSVMSVEAEMHIDAGSTNRSIIANKARADLIKAVLTDPTQGGYASRTRPAALQIQYPDDDNDSVIRVAVTFAVAFYETYGDPYNQP